MTNDDELQWALKEAENLLGVGDRITMAIFNADAHIRELEAERDRWEALCETAWKNLDTMGFRHLRGKEPTHVVVPVEPTGQMLEDGVYSLIVSGLDGIDGVGHEDAKRVYEAMIKAAQEGDNG